MTSDAPSEHSVTCVVFAHNEADTIGEALRSLDAQSVWAVASGHVIVASNGSTDDTAEVVRRYQRERSAETPTLELLDLPRPGKSQTWNTVRELLVERGTGGTVVFVDADVQLTDPTSVEGIDTLLREDQDIWVASCVPERSVPDGTGAIGRMLFRASNDTGGENRVWGGLYGMRARTVAATVMPCGIPLEDGYLAAMMITEHLTAAPEFARVAQTGSTFAVESDPSLRRALRRRTRMLLGATVNHALFSWIRGNAERFDETESVTDLDATRWIDRCNHEQEDWLADLMRRYAGEHRLPISTELIRAGGSARTGNPLGWAARRAAQLAFGSIAYAWATLEFRRRGGVGFW